MRLIYAVLFCFAFCGWNSVFAQSKTILVFDLESGTVDSITNAPCDSAKLFDSTRYSYGLMDSLTALLEETVPDSNVYPGSNFTFKRRVSQDYDPEKYPIRTSVKIFMQRADTLAGDCSGSMISRRHVLTAGHCVSIMTSDTLFSHQFYVCPVYNNGQSNAKYPCSWVKKIYLFKHHSLDDMAILELQDPIGDMIGWIGIGFNSVDSILKQGIYYKFTYPGVTEPWDPNEYNGDTLYYNYGLIDNLSDKYVAINHVFGNPGESGSSIIQVKNNASYTTFGTLSFSTDLTHTRINRDRFYYLEFIIRHDLTYGIAEKDKNTNYSLFPNPAKNRIFIRDPGNQDKLTITISDLWGKEVLSATNFNVLTPLDIRDIRPGIYFVSIWTSASHETKKLIITE